MSLTQTHHVFASVSEGGINTFLEALFTPKGHYIRYASSSLALAATAAATTMVWDRFPSRAFQVEFNWH
jgi:hypothetical protein